MGRAMERSTGWLLLLFFAGCGTAETRFPTWLPRAPAVEAQSYNVHDPFPDEDAGPKTFTRPRAFLEPRSDTRKNLDLRFLKAAYGFPQQRSALWDPAAPVGAVAYPVQPLWRSPQSAAPIAAAPNWSP